MNNLKMVEFLREVEKFDDAKRTLIINRNREVKITDLELKTISYDNIVYLDIENKLDDQLDNFISILKGIEDKSNTIIVFRHNIIELEKMDITGIDLSMDEIKIVADELMIRGCKASLIYLLTYIVIYETDDKIYELKSFVNEYRVFLKK